MNEKTFDILIIGGGLSGLLTAYTLSKKDLSVAIIDKNDLFNSKFLYYDFRTTAISEGSKIFLNKLGLWQDIKPYAQPIKKIKVFDRNHSNKIEFNNPKHNSYLGYIVKNIRIKQTLLKKLISKKNISIFSNNNLNAIELLENFANVYSAKIKIKCKLLIAADGKNSFVRNIIKTPILKKQYNQKATVINLSHKNDHHNIAYEFFFRSGPLAMLPMQSENYNKYCSSIVWSQDVNYNNNLEKLNNDLLKSILEEKLKNYIGEIDKIIDKKTFNLSAHINSLFFDNRLVYIGDSAHSIHPIAGQGWNLGIRNIENLFFSINQGVNLGLDIGDKYICKKYHDLSYQDAFSLFQITDKLNTVFLQENFIIKNFRKIGFNFINKNIILNNFISSFAMRNT